MRTLNGPDRQCAFVGYFVEWDGKFEKFQRRDEGIQVDLRLDTHIWGQARLYLPFNNLETVRRIKPGDRVFFRGVIVGTGLIFELNYVELLRVQPDVA